MRAFGRYVCIREGEGMVVTPLGVRKMLESALREPRAPEIEVTPEMERAGLAAYYDCEPKHYNQRSAHECMARAYRAMRRLDSPAPPQGSWQSGSDWRHQRAGEYGQTSFAHRRKDDR